MTLPYREPDHARMLAVVRACTPRDCRDYASDARPADRSPARDVLSRHAPTVAADDRASEVRRG